MYDLTSVVRTEVTPEVVDKVKVVANMPARRRKFKLPLLDQKTPQDGVGTTCDTPTTPPVEEEHTKVVTVAEIHNVNEDEPDTRDKFAGQAADSEFLATVPDDLPSVAVTTNDNTGTLTDKVDLLESDTGKKRKVTKEARFIFSDDQEEDIVNWLRENPILYNKKLREYSTGGTRKQKLWEDKAADLGCSTTQLYRWWESMRTMYGKLTKSQSGQGTPNFTERQEWIIKTFNFIKPHIVRVPSRSSKVNIENQMYLMFTCLYIYEI